MRRHEVDETASLVHRPYPVSGSLLDWVPLVLVVPSLFLVWLEAPSPAEKLRCVLVASVYTVLESSFYAMSSLDERGELRFTPRGAHIHAPFSSFDQ